MPRFCFRHPKDRRLEAQYGDDGDGHGFYVEFWLLGERTVRFGDDGGNEDECWDPRRSRFWQAIDVLASQGFVAISDIADVLDLLEKGIAAARMPRRLRAIGELVENVREICG